LIKRKGNLLTKRTEKNWKENLALVNLMVSRIDIGRKFLGE